MLEAIFVVGLFLLYLSLWKTKQIRQKPATGIDPQVMQKSTSNVQRFMGRLARRHRRKSEDAADHDRAVCRHPEPDAPGTLSLESGCLVDLADVDHLLIEYSVCALP